MGNQSSRMQKMAPVGEWLAEVATDVQWQKITGSYYGAVALNI